MTRSQATPESSQIITLTRMLEEREETMYAQAAMIEKFRKHMKWNKRIKNLVDQLLSTDGYHEESLPRYHLSLMNFDCIAIPTDSTQVLEEVRRAEREKCAKVCDELRHPDGYSGEDALDWYAGTDHCADSIRAME